MRDLNTRALPIRRQNSAMKTAAVLAAVFVLALPLAPAACAASQDDFTTAIIGDMAAQPSKAAHDVAIQIVKPGNEGLELSARLSETSGPIQRDIAWKLRDADGAVVFNGITALADIVVPPGDYQVEADYGHAKFAQTLTLLEGNRLMVSFVLNVGGIRVLPKVAGIGATVTPSQSRVYALGGINKGKLIATSNLPGEVLRVEAGDYRIESRFLSGNTTAVTDVTVKPGIMSAVEIDHAAGLAKLSYVGSPTAHVSWQITGTGGEEVSPVEGLQASVVLRPGTYTARAQVGSEQLTANFVIAAGQQRDILLGN
jgi:hypothetical protein